MSNDQSVAPGLRRDARVIGLLFASTTSMIGSGWLFGAFHASRIAGPFAALAASLGMGCLATILYIDAYISPGGTGLMYVTGGSRILFAVGELGAGPRWLTRLNSAQVPLLSVLVMWSSACCSCCRFRPGRKWSITSLQSPC
jgi:amino acid transporter